MNERDYLKRINLLMIDNLFIANPTILSDDTIKDYLGLQELKKQEAETLNRLCQALKIYPFYHHVFENYYLNYQIPQIGKEFDLLRIGNDSIVNIELKSEKIDESAILKQLKRNYYYLSFLQKEIFCYSFITDGEINILYYYDKVNENIQQINMSQLVSTLSAIKDVDEDNIDNLFVPSNYLISPFNTTEQFINSEYFLTKHQEQIKDEILKKIAQKIQNKIFSISGTAGTGKTLLTYDIAKKLRNIGQKVTIIHCAQANLGIMKLRSTYGWNIITIRDYNPVNTAFSDILIFDESQRIGISQLMNIVTNEKKFIIFSHDVNQKLNKRSKAEDVVNYIESKTATSNNYKLKNKIRHNKNLASFVKKFYDLSKISSDDLSKKAYDDISFYFTKEMDDAKRYIEYLKNLGWEHIYLSNSLRTSDPLDYVRFSSNNSSHQAIGQEYDNVVVTINEHFFYTGSLKLSYKAGYFYNPLETLFQAITRTRKKLTFVIINNEEVYRNCIKIISGN
jgi:hypothetical protein